MAFGVPAFLFIVCVLFTCLCISVLLAVCAWQFQKIAAKKGHPERRWFWLCLLLGLPGWLMVVALPDLELRRLLDKAPREAS